MAVRRLLHLRTHLLNLGRDKGYSDRLAAQPFHPLVVYTADGREYDVPSHEHAHVSPSGGRGSIWSDDETDYMLPALVISNLKVKSNSQHKP
jgi:hypothetical protein